MVQFKFNMRKYLPVFIFLSFIVLSVSAEKIKCKQCTSVEDANCAQKPDQIEAKDCGDEDDMCIVEIDNKNTVRKCGKKDYCKGPGKDTDTCQECPTAEDCGKVFPENRPQCVQCTGQDCADDSKVPSSLPCVNYDKDEKCYALVTDNKDGYRGCMSDTTSDVCTKSKNEKFCKRCASSEKDCNKNYKNVVECFKCSGNDCKRPKSIEANCKINVATEKCDVLYGRKACYTLKKENEVTRGCLSSLKDPKAGPFKDCAGDKCNSECVKDLECPQCKSPEDPNCSDVAPAKSPCPDYTSTCHWCEDKDGNTHRGCGQGKEGFRCNYGYGDSDPPKKPKIQCYVCQKDDPNCATLNPALKSEECPKEDDACAVLIEGGKTIRGCLSEILTDPNDECKGDEKCMQCKTSNCNGEIFPKNRLQCVQCSGQGCADDSKVPSSSTCVNYDKDDKCYVLVKDDKTAYRGCMSDANNICTKSENEKLCKKCPSKDCNKKSKEEIECYKCSGNGCKRPPGNAASGCTLDTNTEKEKCEVLPGRKACYILRKENEVTRGCLSSLKDPKAGRLEDCAGDKCNKECVKDLECPQCKSPGDPNCSDVPPAKSPCPKYTSACHWCEDKDGNTHRGCGQGGKDFQCNYGYGDSDPPKKPKIRCYKCQNNDPNCATLKTPLESKECPREDDACAVLIEGGKTIRGCLSEIFTDPTKECKEEEDCKQCKSSNCNGEIFPKNRPQCVQCTGKDCADDSKVPSSLPCVNYDKNDKCYVLVTEDKTAYRGCLSDANSNICTKSENDGFCKRCQGKDCNKNSKVEVECFKCSGDGCKRPPGKVEPGCTIDKNTGTEKCEVLPGRKACYTLQKENKVTRGCLSSLKDPKAGPFKDCAGDKCNKECVKDLECPQCKSPGDPNCSDVGFPKSKCPEYTSTCHWCVDKDGNSYRGCGQGRKDFQCNYGYGDSDPPKKPKIRCYKCSKDDPNCATLKTPLESKECPREDDACAVLIEGGKTIRGCLSEILTDPKDECKGDEKCMQCKKSNCNGEIFPKNRLQCVQCSGQGCEDDSNVPSSSTCVNYDKNDKCYVLVKDNKIGYRGCMSDPDNICTKSENDNVCKRCPIKDCNKNSKVEIECFKCSGDGCKRPPGKVKPGCTIDLNTKTEKCQVLPGQKACYTLQKENEVTRGCLSSLKDPKAGPIKDCAGDKCNKECVKDLECPQCKSPGDPNCSDVPPAKSPCPDYTSTCHWCEDKDGNTHRGCGQGGKDSRCNYGYADSDPPKKPKISCYKCSKNDPNCATLKTPLKSEECLKEDDACAVLIEGGKTIRGCLSEIFTDPKKECKEEEYCKQCKSSNCNGDVYPADRRQCYQCEKTEDCRNLPKDKIMPMPCAIFNPNDKCYIYTDETNIFRGCWSDTTKSCKDDDQKCVPCDTSNCNKDPYSRAATLKCMTCDTTKPECAWAQGKDSQKDCTENVLYWEKETCFTYQHNVTVVRRGCTLDSSGLCDNEEKCQKCGEEYCNDKNMIKFTCYRCSSDKNEKCAGTAQGIEPMKCDNNDNLGYNDRGCYVRRDGKKVIRGCLAELDTKVRETCKDKDSKECLKCLDANCNNIKFNSSTTNKLSFVLLCFAVIITRFK